MPQLSPNDQHARLTKAEIVDLLDRTFGPSWAVRFEAWALSVSAPECARRCVGRRGGVTRVALARFAEARAAFEYGQARERKSLAAALGADPVGDPRSTAQLVRDCVDLGLFGR